MTDKKIPQAVRIAVWNKYIGNDIRTSECLIGCGNQIQVTNFECGHVISRKEGGEVTIQNLRPICGPCNKSIGSKNMLDFIETYGFESKIVVNHTKKRDIYLRFIIECTEDSDTHIKTVDLYEYFKLWFPKYNPDQKIPALRSFSLGIKKHKNINKIHFGNQVTSGIKNLQIKKNKDPI